MGVRGLLSFINSRHEDYFVSTKLHSCKVIIDGSNLLYCLYNGCPVRNSCFGGDYGKYYTQVRTYFQRLLDCDIEATVLMDGSFEPAKKATLYKRTREKARYSVCCNPTTHHKNVFLPLFAKEVFIQAIRDLKVKIIQTLSEADSEIARLGKLEDSSSKRCFVVSNDSDFCIYDVNVILLDSTTNGDVIDIDGSQKAIFCRQFDRTKFLAFFKISPEKTEYLHLMATICGNDYMAGVANLSRLFTQVPKVPKYSRKSMSERHQRMFSLLTWLSHESDTKKALEKLLEAVPKEKRGPLRRKLQSSLDIYSTEREPFDDLRNTLLKTTPESFLEKYERIYYPNWLLDIVRHGACFLPIQVEDNSRLSTHIFSQKIFVEICRIVIQPSLALMENDDTPTKVQMVVREKYSTSSVKLEFFKSDDGNSPQASNFDDRRKIFAQALDISIDFMNAIDGEVPELKLIFCVIYFWVTRSFSLSEPVSDLEFSSLVLSLSLWKARADIKTTLKEKIFDLGRICRDRKNVFDASVVHSFANFQAAFYHASVLNRLLSNSVPEPLPVYLWWNGTFLYNIASGFLFSDDSQIIDKVLSLDPHVLEIYSETRQFLKSIIPSANELRTSVTSYKTRNKKRRSKKKSQPQSVENISDDETSDEFIDLNNKFAMLGVP